MDASYKELFNFFSAWFPDADLEGLTDQQVVMNYVEVATDAQRIKVAAQCEQMLSLTSLPLEPIAKTAYRKFDDQETCRAWLKMVYENLRKPNQ